LEGHLKCVLKEIDNIPIREGRKSLGVKITEEFKKQGFREIGELILKKSKQGTSVEKSGCLTQIIINYAESPHKTVFWEYRDPCYS
jgi:hypothetical protein